jgi:hypothetical protein
MDLRSCITQDKFDFAAIDRANQIGFPAINPILLDLLEWLQDANWPIAPDTAALLSRAGFEILPHIRAILKADDGSWKLLTIELVVANLASGIQSELRNEVIRLANHPTQNDRLEGIDVAAWAILNS